MTITPTAQQAAFLTAITDTASHLALVARAGCGKTSTIVMGVAAYLGRNPQAEVLVCAYNKAIQQEVEARIKALGFDWRQAQAATLHSLGWGLLKRTLRLEQKDIDDKKVRRIIEALVEAGQMSNDQERRELGRVLGSYGAQVEALVRFAKQAGFGFFADLPVGDVGGWHQLADHFDVNGLDDTMEADGVVGAAQAVYRMSLAKRDVVDFDDMVLMPLVMNITVRFGKDVVFLDEAQDLSRTRQALAKKFVKSPRGRMVVVGDDRQAIYGFSGADAAALPNLIRDLGAVVLPLSVTWRCPRSVVELAQTLVPDIEAAPGAPEGEVTHQEGLPGDLGPGDVILCRNTAPLVQLAYQMIRAGKACRVEGRAIGEGLQKLALRWKVKSIDALLNKLDAYREREVQKAIARGSEAKAEEVADRVDTLVEVCQACLQRGLKDVSHVVAFIEELFADGAEDVLVLATYHRAKGREWGRVVLWQHYSRCPSRAARQEWQLQQEANLAYVAITRAKRTLIFAGAGQ